MLKNYILVALRNFKRNRFYSFLNIFGLAIGIATAILGFLYVNHELSYDRFHEKSDRTYRIAVEAMVGDTEIHQTYTPAIMTGALYNEFAEIESVCRISGWRRSIPVTYEDKIFKEDNVLLVDTTFFDIFSVDFVHGTPSYSLLAPNKAVLSEKAARKYFGAENPIGKIITINDDHTFSVSAVIKDFPENSHFHFNILASVLSYDGFYNSPQWFANNFQTYLTIHKNSDAQNLESRFPAFVDKYLFDGQYEERSSNGNFWQLYLQPLTNIHLTSHLSGEFEANGNSAYVSIFGIVAILVLLIACINFINLSTAKATTRALEIGVRKVVGSNRTELIHQFISEALVISFVSLGLALIFVEIALIYMPNVVGAHLDLPYFDTPFIIPALIWLALIVGLLSGLYPALVLSSFKPIAVLKNQFQKGRRTPWSRNALVIFQYVVSICLIFGTIVISKQLHFIQNEQLGFDKEHVIVIKNINMIQDNVDVIKNEILNLPGVQSASVSHSLPGLNWNNIGFGAEEFEGGFTLNLCQSDADFEDVLKFNMVKGRYFSDEFGTDSLAVVLNEAAVELIGWDDPIGRKINNWSENNQLYFTVVGVVEDLHYESMHSKIRPMGFFNINGTWSYTPHFLAVRVNTPNIAAIVHGIKDVWQQHNPQVPFEHSFFNETYDSIYANEQRTRRLFIVFSGLAIFIACLGLLGLAAFMARQRTREIGIRKALGATASGLYVQLSVQFTKWVMLANLIAWPLAWFAMNKWLQNFAYHINPAWWMLVLSGLLALFIALSTVSLLTLRAAKANPVEALRYE